MSDAASIPPAGKTAVGAPAAARFGSPQRLFGLALASAFVVGLAHRLLVGWDAPLWLDESFTGAIALQPTFRGLVGDCLNEVGGPLYYCLMWCWAKIAGTGDIPLRIPSFLFAVATPLIIWRKGHEDRTVRATWAAIAATWLPGFYYATEARSYALLFLLGTCQVIYLRRAVKHADLRSASIWAIVSSAMMLTHTHGAIVTCFQGMAILLILKRNAVRLWPAALVAAPGLLWLVMRLPLLIGFSNPHGTWFRLLQPVQLLGLPELMLGQSPIVVLFAAAFLAWCLLLVRQTGSEDRSYRLSGADWAAVGSSLGAIALVIVIGFVRPSFTPRYIIPLVPGTLLGMALFARTRGRWLVPGVMIAAFSLLAMVDMVARIRDPKLDMRRGYSWEEASQYLRERRIQRLVFVWDNVTATGGDAAQLGRVGAFFLHREGVPVAADAVTIGTGTDAEFRRAALALTSSPRARAETVGVVTLGRVLPLAEPGASWTCRRYGGPERAYEADVYVTACARPPLAGK